MGDASYVARLQQDLGQALLTQARLEKALEQQADLPAEALPGINAGCLGARQLAHWPTAATEATADGTGAAEAGQLEKALQATLAEQWDAVQVSTRCRRAARRCPRVLTPRQRAQAVGRIDAAAARRGKRLRLLRHVYGKLPAFDQQLAAADSGNLAEDPGADESDKVGSALRQHVLCLFHPQPQPPASYFTPTRSGSVAPTLARRPDFIPRFCMGPGDGLDRSPWRAGHASTMCWIASRGV